VIFCEECLWENVGFVGKYGICGEAPWVENLVSSKKKKVIWPIRTSH
jgi:hypothetical protein